ncbi:MAG: MFS transporter [Acidobacteriota bacterium]|nr:MFS transporter [Acidobacteriota bacterium]
MNRSIESSRPLRYATLCALYFAQGFPWGFVTVALAAYLNEHGVPRTETAVLLSMSLLPWTFKLIWGPIIDSFQFAAMGLRRPWILFAQAMMALTLVGASSSGRVTDPEALSVLVVVFFLHNCFASLQDVSTDALAMDLLRPEERGRVNGLMWGTKLVGISVGGAVLSMVVVRLGIDVAMRFQALAILAVMLFPLLARERVGERLLPWSKGRRMAPPGASVQADGAGLFRVLAKPLAVAAELRRAFSMRTTAMAGAVALLAFVNQGFRDATNPAVYTQTLGWTTEQYGRAMGLWGTLGMLGGALAGGFLSDRYGRRLVAGCGTAAVFVVMLGFGATEATWTTRPAIPIAFLPLHEAAFAVAQVSLFSLFMKVSWTKAAATQFTMYMTLMNLGTAAGPYLTRLGLGDAASYYVCGVLALVPLALLPLLRPQTVVDRRQAEIANTNAVIVGADSPSLATAG